MAEVRFLSSLCAASRAAEVMRRQLNGVALSDYTLIHNDIEYIVNILNVLQGLLIHPQGYSQLKHDLSYLAF